MVVCAESIDGIPKKDPDPSLGLILGAGAFVPPHSHGGYDGEDTCMATR